jgi:hypothetical protein
VLNGLVVRLTISHRKTLLLRNLNRCLGFLEEERGGQVSIWAVAPLDERILFTYDIYGSYYTACSLRSNYTLVIHLRLLLVLVLCRSFERKSRPTNERRAKSAEAQERSQQGKGGEKRKTEQK